MEHNFFTEYFRLQPKPAGFEKGMVIFMKLKPFDNTLADDMSMYDNLPYERDADRCKHGMIDINSGNILKHYRCSFSETYELSDMDNLAAAKIQEYVQREKERLAVALEPEETESFSALEAEVVDENQLSDEQIQGLVGEKMPRKAFLGDYDEEY